MPAVLVLETERQLRPCSTQQSAFPWDVSQAAIVPPQEGWQAPASQARPLQQPAAELQSWPAKPQGANGAQRPLTQFPQQGPVVALQA